MVNQSLKEQLKLNLLHTLGEYQTLGAAIAIYVDGQSFLEMGVGYQDLKHEQKMPTDANFYIYSITKTLLAIASLHLVSEGTLDLNASVQNYLRNFPLNIPVTLRQLLCHTSGLADYGGTPAYMDAIKATPSSPWSTEAFLDFAKTQDLRFTPDTGWGYSNIGYLLIRCVIEKVTGFSMQQCLHELIFRPLSLQKSFVASTLADFQLTPGYSTFFSGNELQDVTSFYHPGWVAHGVVISTAPELAKIVDGLFTAKLLNSLLVEQMLCPAHILGKHQLLGLLGYGIGLFVGIDSSYGSLAGHVGDGPGYSVAAFHFHNLKGCNATVVALANRDCHDLGLQLVFNIANTIQSTSTISTVRPRRH